MAIASAVVLLTSGARAADVSADAVDACIDAVRAQVGGGGRILGTEFSQANSLVMLQDATGKVWRCVVSNDGSTPYLEASDAAPVHVAPHPDYARGVQGGPDHWRIDVQGTLNVHSGPSTSAPTVAMVQRGMVVENRGCRYNEGRMWGRIADGDATGWAAAEYLVEAAGPAVMPSQPSPAEPTTETVGVQFAAGANGQQRTGTLTPGSAIRFILGAASGQTLQVSFVNTEPAIEYQIFLPNGRVLLDPLSNPLPYQGSLFVNGDHVVEAINRGHQDARYAVWLGIY